MFVSHPTNKKNPSFSKVSVQQPVTNRVKGLTTECCSRTVVKSITVSKTDSNRKIEELVAKRSVIVFLLVKVKIIYKKKNQSNHYTKIDL